MVDLVSLYFGLFIGVFCFTLAKAVEQTRAIWKRTHRLVNAYVALVWVEITVNLIFAVITFLYLNEAIPPTTGFFVASIMLWAIQTQLLPQIIANRVGLIMVNRRKALYLKVGLFVAILGINIAVGFIWVPAMLPDASAGKVLLNEIFEKAEKSFFLVIDLALNLYFLYLVRFRLIADGLSKYWRLFNMNIGAVILSTSMDILLLGFLSLPSPYLYIQWAPSAYIIKLYIELYMANMISKVVRSSGGSGQGAYFGQGSDKSNPTNYMTSRAVVEAGHRADAGPSRRGRDRDDHLDRGSTASDVELAAYPEGQGIRKTVETTVTINSGDESHSNRS